MFFLTFLSAEYVCIWPGLLEAMAYSSGHGLVKVLFLVLSTFNLTLLKCHY